MAMSQRLQIALDYFRRWESSKDVTYRSLLNEYNLKYRVGKKPRTAGFIYGLMRTARKELAKSKIIHMPRAEFIKRPENQLTDTPAWDKALGKLLSDNHHVRVMHMNDLHLPYHDERALELFFEIARRFQPDIVVVGSDAFDYPTISRYEADRDISVDDWLERTEKYWIPVINTLKNIIPNVLLPFIFGNHDRRALVEIKKQSAPKTLMREYRRIIGHGGVFWLGKTEVVKIGALTVAHGTRFNQYASAYTSKDFNFNPVNVGHTHRPQQMLSCVVNGMLCQAVPAYNDNGYPSDWQHGTSTITIDTAHNTVVQSPHLFMASGRSLWSVYGDEVITSKQAYSASEAA